MKKKQRNGRHFNLDDRIEIEVGLNACLSIRDIAKNLGVSPSSISREITRNCIIDEGSALYKCRRFETCRAKKRCGYSACNKMCKHCKSFDCTKDCSYFLSPLDKCPKNLPACNGCNKKKYGCEFTHRLYHAKIANTASTERLTNTRNGFSLTGEDFKRIDDIASPLLKKGQSPYTIINNHPEIGISKNTLYRLIECGELTANNFDLRNKVSRKPRKEFKVRKMNREVVSLLKRGRHYTDYLEYIQEHSVPVAQMDTVIGKADEGVCLLTLHLPEPHFQLALILEQHTSEAVVEALDKLETVLGADLFNKVFPVILTDNGSEFMDIYGMERSCIIPDGKRTKIFFCDPNHSEQKGACENNHKYIRYIIPKGTSLKPYTQDDINLMMCHINSFARESLYGRCPFSYAKAILPPDFFALTGYKQIPKDKVLLKPKLIKK